MKSCVDGQDYSRSVRFLWAQLVFLGTAPFFSLSVSHSNATRNHLEFTTQTALLNVACAVSNSSGSVDWP